MTEREAFIAKIIAEPHEDTHRLVFADWCDENGYEGWAYLIRHQSEPTVCPAGLSADVMFYRKGMEGSCTVKLAEGIRGVQYVVVNGFVSEVRCTLANFTANAKRLFAAHPIVKVDLIDREPFSNCLRVHEWRVFLLEGRTLGNWPGDLPPDFHRFLDNHRPSRSGKNLQIHSFSKVSLANDALSRAAVRYGRWLNGMPQLLATGSNKKRKPARATA